MGVYGVALTHLEERMRTWPRFMTLGDSFTEGLSGDVGPTGRHRGWADRVAVALSFLADDFVYANLAVRGHLLPWIGRRLRGVSSGDGIEPKHPTWHRLAEERYWDMQALLGPPRGTVEER